jgi:hypothetical protein
MDTMRFLKDLALYTTMRVRRKRVMSSDLAEAHYNMKYGDPGSPEAMSTHAGWVEAATKSEAILVLAGGDQWDKRPTKQPKE